VSLKLRQDEKISFEDLKNDASAFRAIISSKKLKMKTFIVNRNTPDLAEDQKRQIELMSKRIPFLNNEIIIYNCNEEIFQGKLVGHFKALQEHRDENCDYYWFNHPDLSFAIDMKCLETLLAVMENNPMIAVISPVHNSYYENMYKEESIWHPVAACDYLSLLIRQSAVKKIGFLNPEFKYCWGAIHEYSYKVHSNGWCIAYCDAAKMHHFGGTTYGKKGAISRDEYIQNAKDFAKNYFVKNYGEGWDKEFAKLLPEGVLNVYSIHRKYWEDTTQGKKHKNKPIYVKLIRRLIRKLKRYFSWMERYLLLYLKKKKVKKFNGEKKLYLGCGNDKREGFINIDIDEKVNPDIVADVKNLNMFGDGSVDEIECCHLFEHLTYPDAVNALKEWYRVLNKGGKLSLELPNLERCLEILYKKEGEEAQKYAMRGIYGYIPDIQKSGIAHIHKYGWTPRTLNNELKKIGFSIIKKVPVTQTWREAKEYNRDMRFVCIK